MHIAFTEEKELLVGMLLGKIEIRSKVEPHRVLYRNNSQVGTNYGLLVLKDNTYLSVDVEGVKWFDSQLNYLGQIIDTQGEPMVTQILPFGESDDIAIRFENRKVIAFSFSVDNWIKCARERSEQAINLARTVEDQ